MEGEFPRDLAPGGEIPKDLAPGGRNHGGREGGGAKSLGRSGRSDQSVLKSQNWFWPECPCSWVRAAQFCRSGRPKRGNPEL